MTFLMKRIVVGAFFLIFVAAVATYLLDIGPFGSSAKIIAVISGVLLALVLHFVGPTLEELRRHRQQ